MTVKELYRFLNEKIPSSLSCEWDNDGLMCCPDSEREVKRVLITLDITAEAVQRAIDTSCDLIISHHPLIFKGLKSVNEESFVATKVIALIKSDISAFSFHTRLDALMGGVNDVLAKRLGINDPIPFGNDGEAIGRIGILSQPMSLSDFADHVKAALGAPAVLCADAGRTVCRVALLGGEGDDDIAAAKAAGADTYVSGRLGYHAMTDAPECGMNLIEAGHFYTEFPVCEKLEALVAEADPTVECTVFFSNKILVI